MITDIKITQARLPIERFDRGGDGFIQKDGMVFASLPDTEVSYVEGDETKTVMTTEDDYFYELDATQAKIVTEQCEHAKRDPELRVVVHNTMMWGELINDPAKMADRILKYYGILLR